MDDPFIYAEDQFITLSQLGINRSQHLKRYPSTTNLNKKSADVMSRFSDAGISSVFGILSICYIIKGAKVTVVIETDLYLCRAVNMIFHRETGGSLSALFFCYEANDQAEQR